MVVMRLITKRLKPENHLGVLDDHMHGLSLALAQFVGLRH